MAMASRWPAALSVAACLALVACSGGDRSAPASTASPTTVSATAVPATTVPAARPTPLVVDTDMGIDDIMAIAYLLQRPDFDIRAITVSGTGLAHCGPGLANLARVIGLVRPDSQARIACGPEVARGGGTPFPEAWRTQADGFYGVTGLPEPRVAPTPDPRGAPAVLAEVLGTAADPVTVLTLGPETNLAATLEAHPDVAAHIHMIWVMGGALTAPGNTGGAAEWNLFADPQAAADVLGSRSLPVTLVPLDATDQVPVTGALAADLEADHLGTSAVVLVRLLMVANPALTTGGFFLWDETTAAVLTDPTLATFQNRTVRVAVAGPDAGRTTDAADGVPMRVVTAVHPPSIERLLLDGWRGRPALDQAAITILTPKSGATVYDRMALSVATRNMDDALSAAVDTDCPPEGAAVPVGAVSLVDRAATISLAPAGSHRVCVMAVSSGRVHGPIASTTVQAGDLTGAAAFCPVALRLVADLNSLKSADDLVARAGDLRDQALAARRLAPAPIASDVTLVTARLATGFELVVTNPAAAPQVFANPLGPSDPVLTAAQDRLQAYLQGACHLG